ncbi:hypothetical protein ColTof4_14446 [Colletotrichum tofieldiae]|nr:hypothetical protein ColTof3_14832 [Colletotrichum tofieldiae]GKT82023.1 hypothetical protein ColTof4_14446 [Colletotrichum tofieldiae]
MAWIGVVIQMARSDEEESEFIDALHEKDVGTAEIDDSRWRSATSASRVVTEDWRRLREERMEATRSAKVEALWAIVVVYRGW